MKKYKIYAVTFLSYTNAMKDTVSDWDGKSTFEIGTINYLDVGHHSFLVREEDLSYFQKFGQGYADIHFVGYLNLPENIQFVDAPTLNINAKTTYPIETDFHSTGNPLEDYNTITCEEYGHTTTTCTQGDLD